jgi:hypothetical protein
MSTAEAGFRQRPLKLFCWDLRHNRNFQKTQVASNGSHEGDFEKAPTLEANYSLILIFLFFLLKVLKGFHFCASHSKPLLSFPVKTLGKIHIGSDLSTPLASHIDATCEPFASHIQENQSPPKMIHFVFLFFCFF